MSIEKQSNKNQTSIKKGGKREGAGRKVGVPNKITLERELRAANGVESAMKSGVLPLDVMLHRMRGTQPVTDNEFAAAVAAAPYIHPRLSAVAQTAMSDLDKFTDQELRDEIARLESERNAGVDPSEEPSDPKKSSGVLH